MITMIARGRNTRGMSGVPQSRALSPELGVAGVRGVKYPLPDPELPGSSLENKAPCSQSRKEDSFLIGLSF